MESVQGAIKPLTLILFHNKLFSQVLVDDNEATVASCSQTTANKPVCWLLPYSSNEVKAKTQLTRTKRSVIRNQRSIRDALKKDTH